jgi:hypothetical protein
MASNIQLVSELSGSIPVATAAGKFRIFIDQSDGLMKLKDHLGIIYPIAGTQDYKDSVRFATNAALPPYARVGNIITASGVGPLPNIDGVAPVLFDTLLLLNGASAADNGIWVVTDLGSGGSPFVLERRGDFAASAQISPGCVTTTGPEGSVNESQIWILATAAPITLNTTPLNWVGIGGGTSGGGGFTLEEITSGEVIPVQQDMVFIEDITIGDNGDLVSRGNVTPGRTEDNYSIAYVPLRTRRVIQQNDRMPYTAPLVVDGDVIVDGDMVDVTPYDGFDILAALALVPGEETVDRTATSLSSSPVTIYSYATTVNNGLTQFDLLVGAQSNVNNDTASFRITAAFHRAAGAGTVTNKDVNFINGPYLDAGAAAWDVIFNISGGGPVIDVQVVGDAGESIDWRMTGKVVEHG